MVKRKSVSLLFCHTTYYKTPVIQSVASHCIKLAVWAYLL